MEPITSQTPGGCATIYATNPKQQKDKNETTLNKEINKQAIKLFNDLIFKQGPLLYAQSKRNNLIFKEWFDFDAFSSLNLK